MKPASVVPPATRVCRIREAWIRVTPGLPQSNVPLARGQFGVTMNTEHRGYDQMKYNGEENP